MLGETKRSNCDCAPATINTRVGAVTKLTEHAKEQVEVVMGGVSNSESYEIMRYHCIIHQEALCPKAIGFEGVKSAVIKDVNFFPR